jgi:hypothetical protein
MVSPSSSSAPTLQAFRAVPRTGVVYVTKEATARGYRTGDFDEVRRGLDRLEAMIRGYQE